MILPNKKKAPLISERGNVVSKEFSRVSDRENVLLYAVNTGL